MFYTDVRPYLKAPEKIDRIKDKSLANFAFSEIAPDANGQWLNQSDGTFEQLTPLANRETKLAKTAANEQAVFKLNSLGIVTARDEWVYDFDENALLEKVQFFCSAYQREMQRYLRELPAADAIGAWVDRTIKWTSELTDHLTRGSQINVSLENIVHGLYRPFVIKQTYYAPIISHRRYQLPSIFPHGLSVENPVICVCRNGKDFYVLASKYLPDYHLTGDSDCLPLYRYTADGERVSNITEWGLRQFREHYGDDAITAEDVFAYTYAMLHDPAYRQRYEIDLRREFPRVYFQEDFAWWAQKGRELLDLHLGFETAEPWPLERNDVGANNYSPLRGDTAPNPSSAPTRIATSSSWTTKPPCPASPMRRGGTNSAAAPRWSGSWTSTKSGGPGIRPSASASTPTASPTTRSG